MSAVLEIQNIGKQYGVGERERYLALRDVLSSPLQSLGKVLKKMGPKKEKKFWALEDVSFDVMSGDSIGIIGRNGAGKSTLLKILSRITPPTRGKIVCRGRVASLLEVGTGFHPELTGRENIYMNGSILGMKRSEIANRFDEIVDFSGVSYFLDTPLKRYSSGMQLRLAFGVAAHLEPEILIIDEVLAVGDAEFQKKCLGKMKQVSSSGRTVLFVSHDLTAIRNLTTKAVLLDKGKLIDFDASQKVIEKYIGSSLGNITKLNVSGVESALLSAFITDEAGNATTLYDISKPFFLTVAFTKTEHRSLSIEIFLKDEQHNKMAIASMSHFEDVSLPSSEGTYTCSISLQNLNLASGRYLIDIAISVPKIGWDVYAEDALWFEVLMCNPKQNSWDLKQEFRYGNLAWMFVETPKFVSNAN